MKDKLEKFILENKEEFDIYEPSAEVWKKIEKKVQPRKTIKWGVVFSRAAAVLVIFIASYMVHEFIGSRKPALFTGNSEKRELKTPKIPELQEAEVYYSNLISEKLNEIKPVFEENPSLEKEIKVDMKQLDSAYNVLKHDLKDNIANEEVIEAMIQNYRLRLEILEDVLSMIKPEEDEKNTKNNEFEL